jgi:large conductance mechanosensitive channel
LGLLGDLKSFALRGSLLDLAIGFTVGAAFSTIAKSLVDDLLMPPVGLVLGGADFADLHVLLKPGTAPPPYASLAEAQAAGAVTLNYGRFLNSVLAFAIVTLAMFAVVRLVQRLDARLEAQLGDRKPSEEPDSKKCPWCREVIPYRARRCPRCTSRLEGERDGRESAQT